MANKFIEGHVDFGSNLDLIVVNEAMFLEDKLIRKFLVAHWALLDLTLLGLHPF